MVNRRISVTPIHLDLTGRSLMRQLKSWDWTLEADAAPEGVPTTSPVEQERIAEEAQIERR